MLYDIEKQRVEYVTHLETLVKNLQEQVQQLKEVEYWVPRIGTEVNPAEQNIRLTLSFAGVNQSSKFTYQALQQYYPSEVAYTISRTFSDIILDKIKEVIQPEIERLKPTADVLKGVGKW